MINYLWGRSIMIRLLNDEELEKLHNKENRTDKPEKDALIDYGFKSRELMPFEIRIIFKKPVQDCLSPKELIKIQEMINEVIANNKEVLYKNIYDATADIYYYETSLEQIHFIDMAIHCQDSWDYLWNKKYNKNPAYDNTGYGETL